MFLDKRDKSQFKSGMLVKFNRPKCKDSRCSGCILEVRNGYCGRVDFAAKKPKVVCGRVIGQLCHVLSENNDYCYEPYEDLVTGVLSIDEQGI